MSVNKVILVGNVGKDPEVKHLDQDKVVANFSIATSESYKNKDGEKITNTEWHHIVCWRGLAKLAESYIKKGSQLYIEGKIRTRSYDAQDGSKRYVTEVYADSIQFLGRKSDGGQSRAKQQAEVAESFDSQKPIDNKEGDDLPF